MFGVLYKLTVIIIINDHVVDWYPLFANAMNRIKSYLTQCLSPSHVYENLSLVVINTLRLSQ